MMVSGVWRGERGQMAEKDGNVFDRKRGGGLFYIAWVAKREGEEDIKRKLLFNIASH